MSDVLRFTTEQAPQELTVPAKSRLFVIEEGFPDMTSPHPTIVTVQEGAHVVYSFNLHSQGALRRSITIRLEDHAEAEFIGLVLGDAAANIQLTLTEDHAKGPSWARTTLRGLLNDTARLHLGGTIAIRPEANQSDALLEGRVMLLSPDARAEIIPSLEIEARDVKATHAAAVGPLDPEQLFYLQARGCTLEEARTMLLQGFLGSLLSRLPETPERAELQQRWEAAVRR